MTHPLEGLRQEIDAIDVRLVKLLAERARVVAEVAEVKAANGIPAFIPERVEEVISQVRELAGREGMEPDLAEAVWRAMIDWFVAFEAKHLGK